MESNALLEEGSSHMLYRELYTCINYLSLTGILCVELIVVDMWTMLHTCLSAPRVHVSSRIHRVVKVEALNARLRNKV